MVDAWPNVDLHIFCCRDGTWRARVQWSRGATERSLYVPALAVQGASTRAVLLGMLGDVLDELEESLK